MSAPPARLQERLDNIVDMVRALSKDTDPVRSVQEYATSMRRLFNDQGLISVSMRGVPAGQYRVMRLLHERGAHWEGIHDTLFAGRDARAHEGGFIGDIIASGKPYVTRNLNLPDDPVLGVQLAGYRTLVAFPVFDQGIATNWAIFLHTRTDQFDDRDIEMWALQVNLMGGITNLKRLTREVYEANEYIQRQVDEIANIQRSMLPQKLPRVDGLDLAAMYETYDRAGGDYYDLLRVRSLQGASAEDPRWLILVADASGHGPSAAVLVAMLSALLHSFPGAPESPSDVLHYLNRHLLTKRVYNAFVTAIAAVYDPRDGSITWASAGHPPPLLRRECGTVLNMPLLEGIPLGILPETNYTTESVVLEPGQCMLLYTDGITEARSRGAEMFGTERLMQSLGVCGRSAQQSLDDIVERLRAHEAGQHQDDDQTMLVLRAKDAPAAN
ncbi:MAG: SpoIIE family protein phosphatase [Candidatus Hydrogenedens sp.]|nr:SpoIIE family protein phosphatase [Candidatus Hydrogenedens sp.]